MIIRTAINRALVASGILVLAACTGVAIVHARTQGKLASDGTGAISTAVSAPSPRDPASLADRLRLDTLMTIRR